MGILLMTVSYSCSITAIYLHTPLMVLCPHIALSCNALWSLLPHCRIEREEKVKSTTLGRISSPATFRNWDEMCLDDVFAALYIFSTMQVWLPQGDLDPRQWYLAQSVSRVPLAGHLGLAQHFKCWSTWGCNGFFSCRSKLSLWRCKCRGC